MSYYFLSQQFVREHVLFLYVENDIKHTSVKAIQATHFSPEPDKPFEVRCSTSHSTAVMNVL